MCRWMDVRARLCVSKPRAAAQPLHFVFTFESTAHNCVAHFSIVVNRAIRARRGVLQLSSVPMNVTNMRRFGRRLVVLAPLLQLTKPDRSKPRGSQLIRDPILLHQERNSHPKDEMMTRLLLRQAVGATRGFATVSKRLSRSPMAKMPRRALSSRMKPPRARLWMMNSWALHATAARIISALEVIGGIPPTRHDPDTTS